MKFNVIIKDQLIFWRTLHVHEGQQLKEAGLKVTLPRLKILQILEHNKDNHLSAESVYKILLDLGEDVGLATVYRVLTQFENAGLIERHNFEGNHAVFELKSEVHHDHLVCLSCGKVIEFVDEIIEERQKIIAQNVKFKMSHHSLNIYGLCDICF